MIERRIPPCGDPFHAEAQRHRELERERDECAFCWDSGYVFLGGLNEDGEEVTYAVPCQRCNYA